jgi:hypothetical protein
MGVPPDQESKQRGVTKLAMSYSAFTCGWVGVSKIWLHSENSADSKLIEVLFNKCIVFHFLNLLKWLEKRSGSSLNKLFTAVIYECS